MNQFFTISSTAPELGELVDKRCPLESNRASTLRLSDINVRSAPPDSDQ